MQVDDDGDGRRLGRAPRVAALDGEGGGNGIPGMRERAVALGGTFDAGAPTGGGFRVRARIPVPERVTAVIRVLLADDQALVRAGFRALLDAQDDIEVVGEAADGARRSSWRASSSPTSC